MQGSRARKESGRGDCLCLGFPLEGIRQQHGRVHTPPKAGHEQTRARAHARTLVTHIPVGCLQQLHHMSVGNVRLAFLDQHLALFHQLQHALERHLNTA